MHISARVTVMLTAVASTAVVAAAAPPAGSATASSSWRVALKVSGRNGPEFMAVTATSARNAWAFGGNDINIPLAYHLSGSAWRKASFPRAVGDVIAASASSASNVWAFGSRDAARYNGARWSVMKKLGYIDSGLAVSAASVWVFGGATSTASVASWHYNGKSWTRIASGSGLEGASAAGAANVWAYGGKDVAHWNGRAWTKTSVARLLPKNTSISRSFLTGIYAAGARNVYAIGSGGAESVGGPIVVLHYNGSKWRRVVQKKSPGAAVGVAPDGRGGLWLPQDELIEGSMVHFTHGKLTEAALPYKPARLYMKGVAREPGSAAALAVGGLRKNSVDTEPIAAVIFRYGS